MSILNKGQDHLKTTAKNKDYLLDEDARWNKQAQHWYIPLPSMQSGLIDKIAVTPADVSDGH
ncbi:MAG: hypothetical protein HRT36_01215 [Alphaproteobacteria bacterium]|nr:hypothetical protein [Alphaproteobacteria bacterium]